MNIDTNRRQWLMSWGFLGLLVAISVVLGVLQYRWIGEVSRAERERLRAGLETSLRRLANEFNAEITNACMALMPETVEPGEKPDEAEIEAHWLQWHESNRHGRLIRNVWLVIPEHDKLRLRWIDSSTHKFRTVDWPEAWSGLQDWLESRLNGNTRDWRGTARLSEEFPTLVEVPLFARPVEDRPQSPRDLEWMLVEVDQDYLRDAILPELLARHLGGGGIQDYQVEVSLRDRPEKIVYRSDPARQASLASNADASVRLFELRFEMLFRRMGGVRMRLDRDRDRDRERESASNPPPPPLGGNPAPGPGPGLGGPGPAPSPNWRNEGIRRPAFTGSQPPGGGERGRWNLAVRHRAGSLEKVVERARWRNMAVTAGLLALIIAAGVALVQFTRRAQHLAELQMEFVAGVSHELRTPLSVMRTAGHNLRGRVANDPARVQRYGALIEEESEKLTGIVEQVLRFANTEAGRAVVNRVPVDVGQVIDEAIADDGPLLEQMHCALEREVSSDLPAISGDATMLKHALKNLISNAAKHGGSGEYVGVFAQRNGTPEHPEVEVRVKDRGPGIPAEELKLVFDPFYRGRQAIADQIHGTGLGLSLTKRIIEAHKGRIAVHSEPGQGTEFVIRIPAAVPAQEQA